MLVIAALQGSSAFQQWQGMTGTRTEAETLVIKDQSAWTNLWAELKREPPQATLDNKHIAVAIFCGTKPTAGYKVTVRGAHEESGHYVVEYVETGPAPDQMVAQVLTHPWVVAVLPASALPVVFKKLPS
jgi:hypothetical protein